MHLHCYAPVFYQAWNDVEGLVDLLELHLQVVSPKQFVWLVV